jgi:hypothetical protein
LRSVETCHEQTFAIATKVAPPPRPSGNLWIRSPELRSQRLTPSVWRSDPDKMRALPRRAAWRGGRPRAWSSGREGRSGAARTSRSCGSERRARSARAARAKRGARSSGPQGGKGDQGPPCAPGASLHLVRQDSCQGSSNCNLACDAGETIASITCPQGAISITKNGDTETVSCSNSPGPALAICVHQ